LPRLRLVVSGRRAHRRTRRAPRSSAIRGPAGDLPVAITNDANAAAIGELLFGGARGMKHAFVITLGTGLGRENRLLVLQPKAKRLLVRAVGEQGAPPSKRPPSASAELEAAA
jgi:hypothetical protein